MDSGTLAEGTPPAPDHVEQYARVKLWVENGSINLCFTSDRSTVEKLWEVFREHLICIEKCNVHVVTYMRLRQDSLDGVARLLRDEGVPVEISGADEASA
ncbi:MAG: hypothetical protein WDZ82_01195 [Candidatus Paceibacterota bacterium]